MYILVNGHWESSTQDSHMVENKVQMKLTASTVPLKIFWLCQIKVIGNSIDLQWLQKKPVLEKYNSKRQPFEIRNAVHHGCIFFPIFN